MTGASAGGQDHGRRGPRAGDAAADSAREDERIRAAYRYYDSSDAERSKRDASNPGNRRNVETRWAAMRRAIAACQPPDHVRVLDVGCGTGQELRRIAGELAPLNPSLHGVDLLADRIERARENVPTATFHVCGAQHLPYPDRHFEIVIAALVFSSILDDGLARAVAHEMTRVVAAGGAILCYDMRYPNPWNPRIRAIGVARLQHLFPGARLRVSTVTLLPQLARRLGATAAVTYRPLHALPPLRSHYLSEIRPASPDS